MADMTPSFLPERSIDSTTLMPFSSSMGRGCSSTLWQQRDTCVTALWRTAEKLKANSLQPTSGTRCCSP
eukprot:4884868-Prymnesium_polylepis.1